MAYLISTVILCGLAIAGSSTISETNTTSKSIETQHLEITLAGRSGTKTELCSHRPCIRKCCSINSIAIMKDEGANSGNCKSKAKLNLTLDFPQPKIYTRDREVTEKQLNSTFEIIKGYPIIRDGWIGSDDFYIIEDGTLQIEAPNFYNRWRTFDSDNFCVDYVKMYGTDEVVIRPFFLATIDEDDKRNHTVAFIAMAISSVFLVATLAVYGYVPRLRRRVHGKILVAYASCLLAFFLIHLIYEIIHQLNGIMKIQCHIMGVPTYFLMLAPFFWMNIMSYDIWLKSRSVSTSATHENKMFPRYCAYGFGGPLAMTIMFAFLNYLPMETINRAVVTPGIVNKGCFLGGTERLLYLYIPMTILITANFFLFLATAVNIYRLNSNSTRNQIKDSNSRSHGSHKKQFLLYMKVFLLMGVTWILMIVSSFEPTLLIWKFTDAFNFLIGIFVFLIFVCKKRVFRMIKERYRGKRPVSTYPATVIRNYSSESSDEELNDMNGLGKGSLLGL